MNALFRAIVLLEVWTACTLCSVVDSIAAALEGAAAPVWSGVDMSQLPNEGDDHFRASPNGPVEEPLTILANAGINTFRARIWNSPCADGRCDPTQYQYGSTPSVLKMATKCKAAGLQFVLDFHYSDWWADPSQQYKPTAWRNLTYDELADAVYSYTKETVAALVAQGKYTSLHQEHRERGCKIILVCVARVGGGERERERMPDKRVLLV